MKPSDDLVLPLSHAAHMEQHHIGERPFWLKVMQRDSHFMMECVKAYARQLYRENRREEPKPTAEKKKRACKGCGRDISHKHINAKFHSQQCKDDYWNTVNPRGYGLERDEDIDGEGPGWDAHKDSR